jgi:hypothetical protein
MSHRVRVRVIWARCRSAQPTGGESSGVVEEARVGEDHMAAEVCPDSIVRA